MIACAQLAAKAEQPFALLPRRRAVAANHPAGAKVIPLPMPPPGGLSTGSAGEFRQRATARPYERTWRQRQLASAPFRYGWRASPSAVHAGLEKLFFAVGHVEQYRAGWR